MTFEIIFIGLLVSLLFISIVKYYPGGIIVPGYLVLFVDQPYRLAGTFIASLLTMLIYKIASRYMILFGRRRFVFMILFGALITFLLSNFLPDIFTESIELKVIGWVIPGLIAINFEKQGVIITSSCMVAVITATYYIGQIYFSIF